MSYLVLARKWRPRNFAELVGQEHVRQALVNALDSGRVHHAFLFTGTRGVGKTTIARILARALNCERGVGSSPCGECAACREIDEGRFGRLVNAEANISRDRLGQFDLTSWRYTAAGMPGGVMLQIGIHYTDVLEYLMGPIKAVRGSLAQLVLPGDNPDVASLVLEHENGALSTLNASYASASEYYLMNIYGKEATAYYDLHNGLRVLRRGTTRADPVPCAKNDTIVEELEEFARAVRGDGQPEMDGEKATTSLAVLLAGIKSAREGRRVEIAEIMRG